MFSPPPVAEITDTEIPAPLDKGDDYGIYKQGWPGADATGMPPPDPNYQAPGAVPVPPGPPGAIAPDPNQLQKQMRAPAPRPQAGPPPMSPEQALQGAGGDPRQQIQQGMMQSMQAEQALQAQGMQDSAAKRQMMQQAMQDRGQDRRAIASRMEQAGNRQPPPPPEMFDQDTRGAMAAWLGISAVAAGLMAGKSRRSQMFALSAFSGMVNGFMAGKKDEAQRNWEIWQAQSKQAEQQNKREIEKLKDIMENSRLDFDEKMQTIELYGAETRDKILYEQARQKNFTLLGTYLDKKEEAHLKLEKANVDLDTKMLKFQQQMMLDQAGKSGLNTPAGLAKLQEMISGEKDEKKKEQMLWLYKQLHPGLTGGSGSDYPGLEEEKEAAKPKSKGNWFSRLWGGGEEAAPAAKPGSSKEAAITLTPGKEQEEVSQLPYGSWVIYEGQPRQVKGRGQ